MTTIQALERFQELLLTSLEDKTNWGRNDLKALIKDVNTEVVKEHVEQLEDHLSKFADINDL